MTGFDQSVERGSFPSLCPQRLVPVWPAPRRPFACAVLDGPLCCLGVPLVRGAVTVSPLGLESGEWLLRGQQGLRVGEQAAVFRLESDRYFGLNDLVAPLVPSLPRCVGDLFVGKRYPEPDP